MSLLCIKNTLIDPLPLKGTFKQVIKRKIKEEINTGKKFYKASQFFHNM